MLTRTLQPQYPFQDVIGMFVHQARTQLEVNYRTQRIYPHEIYTGFRAVNAYRKAKAQGDHDKGWFADGDGARSFEGYLVKADADQGIVDILFSFNDYLRYVDIGVGAGTKAADVERSRNVRYKTRYTPKWNRAQGRSHRPAIMPEMRHLQRRVMNYLVDFYGNQGELAILQLVDNEK